MDGDFYRVSGAKLEYGRQWQSGLIVFPPRTCLFAGIRRAGLILSESPGAWADLFAALDAAGIPDDFMADRAQGLPQVGEEL
jgi:hypothetical protein